MRQTGKGSGEPGATGVFPEHGRAVAHTDLAGFGLVDDGPDADLDHIVRTAARLTACEKAFITFAQGEVLHILAAVGSDTVQTPAADTVCGTVYRSGAPLIVSDLRTDPRFAGLPYVEMENGSRFYAGFPIHLNDGHAIGTLCVIDRTVRPQGLTPDEQAQMESLTALTVRVLEGRQRDARWRDYLDIASDWIWEQDEEFRFSYISRSSLGTGMPSGEMLGTTRWEAPSAATEGPAFWARHKALLEAHEPFRDLRYRWLDGDTERVTMISGKPVFAQDGAFLGYRGTARDVTEEERTRREVEHMAHHDALTGVANRPTFEARIADAFRAWEETGATATVFLLDIDHFKRVNDTYGHSTGDDLLVEVARRLTECTGPEAVVARLGGDEFAVLDPSLSRGGAVDEYAAMLLQAIARPFEAQHDVIECGSCLGIAVLPDDGGSFSQIMGNADLALYEAKARGRGRHMAFQPRMRRQADSRNTLARELSEAFHDGQFDLTYQPIVRIADQRIVGAEALLRWNHPERGRLLPSAFLAALDSGRHSVDVGYWVLETACRAALPWVEARKRDFRLSVNLFTGQVRDPRLVNRVQAILDKTGFRGTNLELEVTEDVLLTPLGDLPEVLKALKRLGISVALDDFGTGFGSLNHLLQFAIDRIKVDRQFVRGLGNSIDHNTVTHAIVKLAVDLGLKVTAEGIETDEQQHFLSLVGCDDMQGFHFSRPVSAEQFPRLLEKTDALITRRHTGGPMPHANAG